MLAFEPDEQVWREIAIDGSATLDDFHDAIFEAFDRPETHADEFITHDQVGIVTRRDVHSRLADGEPSWQSMTDAGIDRFIDRVVPDGVSEDANDRFRELRRNPPPEGNAAETTLDSLDPVSLQSIFYAFDLGDGWEHVIERKDGRDGGQERSPEVVAAQGEAPPQHPASDG